VPTGTVIPVCNSTGCTLFINGVSGQNVFDLDLKSFGKPVAAIDFAGPSDATFILDLAGSSITMKGIGFNLASGIDFTDILWNTSSASDVTLDQVGLPGTLLAPSADVDLASARINGNLYSFNLEGNGAVNAVPEPGSWVSFLTGLGALAAARFGRRNASLAS
jgi:choice-of-anchor A domain-containing protein